VGRPRPALTYLVAAAVVRRGVLVVIAGMLVVENLVISPVTTQG
jgi:hypothetical protein